jgi:hypothetical protein
MTPAATIVVLTNVTEAVAVASRVFAGHFVIPSVLAELLAARARSWAAVAGLTAIGLVVAFIMIFGPRLTPSVDLRTHPTRGPIRSRSTRTDPEFGGPQRGRAA